MSDQLIVVTGATGNIGKKISEILLKNGRKVRVIGRSTEKLRKLVDSGAEAAVGDLADAEFLTKALQGADSIFAMVPPNLTAENFRKYQGTVSDSIVSAIRKSGLKKVVALSSLGADLAEGTGVVTGLHDFEQKLGSLEGVDILI